MKTVLLQALEEKIQEWIDEHCDTIDWPEIYVGDFTVSQMSNAAAAVFDAIEDVQKSLERDGVID